MGASWHCESDDIDIEGGSRVPCGFLRVRGSSAMPEDSLRQGVPDEDHVGASEGRHVTWSLPEELTDTCVHV